MNLSEPFYKAKEFDIMTVWVDDRSRRKFVINGMPITGLIC